MPVVIPEIPSLDILLNPSPQHTRRYTLTHRLVNGVASLNLCKLEITRNGRKCDMTGLELCVVGILMRNPVIIPKEELHKVSVEMYKSLYDEIIKIPLGERAKIPPAYIRIIHGYGSEHVAHTIMSIISRTREALNANGEPNVIGTYRVDEQGCEGYRMEDEETVNHPRSGQWRKSANENLRMSPPLQSAAL